MLPGCPLRAPLVRTGTASCKHRVVAQDKRRLAEHLHAPHRVQGALGITRYPCTVGQGGLMCHCVGTLLPAAPCRSLPPQEALLIPTHRHTVCWA